MVRIAKKDTYATEDVGNGVEVRRAVFAGQRVPESFDIDAGDVDEIEENPSGLRFATAVENPTTLDEGDPEPSDESPDQVSIADGDPGSEEAAEAEPEPEPEEVDEKKPASHRRKPKPPE